MIVKIREFAWLPKRLSNGKLIWLKPYCAYYDVVYTSTLSEGLDNIEIKPSMIEIESRPLKDCND